MFYFSNIKQFVYKNFNIAKLVSFDKEIQFSYKYYLVIKRNNVLIDIQQFFFLLYKFLFFLQIFIKNSGQLLFLNNNKLYSKFIYNTFGSLYQLAILDNVTKSFFSNFLILRKIDLKKNSVVLLFNSNISEPILLELWKFNFPIILLGFNKFCKYITYNILLNINSLVTFYFFSIFLSCYLKLYLFKYKNIFSYY
jgi:hypothetical protein